MLKLIYDMQTPPASRQRRLNIRLSQQEWDRVQQLASHTTCRSISEYSRQLLLDKPVRVFYRNQSFDDFEQLMIRLLASLDGFEEKLDLALKKIGLPITRADVLQLLAAHEDYAGKVEEIKQAIIKIADQCAQK